MEGDAPTDDSEMDTDMLMLNCLLLLSDAASSPVVAPLMLMFIIATGGAAMVGGAMAGGLASRSGGAASPGGGLAGRGGDALAGGSSMAGGMLPGAATVAASPPSAPCRPLNTGETSRDAAHDRTSRSMLPCGTLLTEHIEERWERVPATGGSEAADIFRRPMAPSKRGVRRVRSPAAVASEERGGSVGGLEVADPRETLLAASESESAAAAKERARRLGEFLGEGSGEGSRRGVPGVPGERGGNEGADPTKACKRCTHTLAICGVSAHRSIACEDVSTLCHARFEHVSQVRDVKGHNFDFLKTTAMHTQYVFWTASNNTHVTCMLRRATSYTTNRKTSCATSST